MRLNLRGGSSREFTGLVFSAKNTRQRLCLGALGVITLSQGRPFVHLMLSLLQGVGGQNSRRSPMAPWSPLGMFRVKALVDPGASFLKVGCEMQQQQQQQQ